MVVEAPVYDDLIVQSGLRPDDFEWKIIYEGDISVFVEVKFLPFGFTERASCYNTTQVFWLLIKLLVRLHNYMLGEWDA
jgi:hypothetical protein